MANDSPKFTDSIHNARKDDLALMHAFKGGKKTVTPYLNKWERETEAGYASRQRMATLFNQVQKTIKTASGLIFRKELALKDLDKDFVAMIKDVDGCDTSLNDFAKDVNNSALWDGISYILVDMPKNDGEVASLQAQIEKGIIPYFTKIEASQILNRRVVNNRLVQVTIQETIKEYEGNFKEKTVTQERVLSIGGGAVYRDNVKIYEWTNALTYIPLVPVYTNKVGYLDGTPHYLDLAELNLKHFNFQSQLDKTLFIASNPIPLVWGVAGKELTIGVDEAMSWQNKNDGGFEWCEFAGTSVDKLQEEIGKIEARMLSIGLSMFTEKEQTAKEAIIASVGETSDLASIATSLEDSLNVAYGYWCDMMKKKQAGEITANRDFTGATLSPQEAKMYLDMYTAGTITLEQFWDEMEKREYLSTFDREVAKAQIEAQNQETSLA